MKTSKHSIPSGHPAVPASLQSRMQRGATVPSNSSLKHAGVAPVPGSVQSAAGSEHANPVHQWPIGSRDATSTTGAHSSEQSAEVSQLAQRSGGASSPVELDEPAAVDPLDPLASLDALLPLLLPGSEEPEVPAEVGPCPVLVVPVVALPLPVLGSPLLEPMALVGTH